MAAILKIKDKDGNIIDVPAIRGKKGNPGITPNLTIGVVETLPSGSEASATITGTIENPKLNLGIPKGDTGETVSIEGLATEEYVDALIGDINSILATLSNGGVE